MVSKNNKYQKQLMTLDREVPHYSLRKLGIGVVSVLLGTTMYLGANSTVANAATVNGASGSDSNTTQSGAAAKTNALQSASAVTMSTTQSTTAASTAQSSQAVSAANNNVVSAAGSVSSTSTAVNTPASQSTATSSATTAASQASQSFKPQSANQQNVNWGMVYKANVEESNGSTTATSANSQSVTLSDGSTLSIDMSDFDQNKNASNKATLTFTGVGSATGGVKPGDKYEFTLPSRFAHFTASDVTYLDPSVGKTTEPIGDNNNPDSEEYYTGYTTVADTIASTFNNTTFSQTFGIDITPAWNLFEYACEPDSVYPGEKFTFPITISKNGKEIKTIECTYTLPEKLQGSLGIKLANKYLPTNKNGEAYIYNNKSYKYVFRVANYGLAGGENVSSWNNGVKIRFSVPKYFELDKTVPVSVTGTQGEIRDSSGISLSQDGIGNDVYITIPAKSKALDSPLYSDIWFNGIMKAPDNFLQGSNTEALFDNEVLTQTFLNNSVQTINGNKSTFIIKPLPKDISDGVIFEVQKQQSGCRIGMQYNGQKDAYNDPLSPGLAAPSETGLFNITNVSKNTQKNIHIHVDNPDGLGIKTYAIRVSGQTTPIDYTATCKLINGDVLHFSREQDVNHYIFLNNYLRIKSIDITISELEPMATVQISPEDFVIFKKNAEGKALMPGQNLRSAVNVDGGINHHEQLAVLFTPVVDQNSMDGYVKAIQISQGSKNPGSKSGAMQIALNESKDFDLTHLKLENPVFYIRLPKNVSIVDKSAFINSMDYHPADDDSSEKITPDEVSFFSIGNDNFVEINLNGKSIKEFDAFCEGLQNVQDTQTTDKDPLELYVTSDNINSIKSKSVVNVSQLDAPVKTIGEELANYEGISEDELKGFYKYDNWHILTTSATSSIEQAEGNQELGLVLAGKSEDHAGTAMTYATSIVNSTKTPLTNVQSFTNLPNTSDGKSGFDVTLTGPAKLVDPATGKTIDGAKVKYSTQAVTISKDVKPSQDGFVDGDQISDWSTVRSVLVTIPKLAAYTTARLVLPGEDQHIYDHAGKTAYLSSVTWADEKQKPLTIASGDSSSSNITVTEQDKINVEIHYKDKNGKDIYVELPDKAKIYNYGDTMKKSDFLQSDADLSDDDKAKLPAGLNIDYTNPTIQNSSDTYENGYENGTASFGEKGQVRLQ